MPKCSFIAALLRICLLHAIIICGCRHDNADHFIEEFKKADAFYCSSDIALAERATLQHYNTLLKWQASGVKGIDYHLSIAEAAGRLFLIYHSEGETTKAEHFFQESAKHFNNRRRSIGRESEIYTHEMIAEQISQADSKLDVQWQKNRLRGH